MRRGIQPLLLSVLLLSSVWSACIPFPHRSIQSPSVAGVIQDASPDSVVRVFASGACAGRFAEAEVAADGRFAVCPVPDFRWSLVIMGHRFYEWTLCIPTVEGWGQLHTDRSYGLVDSGPTGAHYLACTIGSDTCQAAPVKEHSELKNLLRSQCE